MDAFAKAASTALVAVRLVDEAGAFALGFADVLTIASNRALHSSIKIQKLILVRQIAIDWIDQVDLP